MSALLAAQTADEGGGVNLVVVALVIAAIAIGFYLWKKRR
jgi:LPXTG-motif cell wall-anchored protein